MLKSINVIYKYIIIIYVFFMIYISKYTIGIKISIKYNLYL